MTIFPKINNVVQLLTYYTAEVQDFTSDALSLVFASLVEGVTACATINTTEDQLLEGPETFEVRIAENSSFPDAEVFHNELLLIIRDQGSHYSYGFEAQGLHDRLHNYSLYKAVSQLPFEHLQTQCFLLACMPPFICGQIFIWLLIIIIIFADSLETTINVTAAQLSVEEYGGTSVEVCLTVDGDVTIGNPFTAELTVNDASSTATLGRDFQFPMHYSSDVSDRLLVDFVPGSMLTACGVVAILDDDVFEDVEIIILTICNTSINDFATASGSADVEITIAQDPQGRSTYVHWCQHYYKFKITIFLICCRCNNISRFKQ